MHQGGAGRVALPVSCCQALALLRQHMLVLARVAGISCLPALLTCSSVPTGWAWEGGLGEGGGCGRKKF